MILIVLFRGRNCAFQGHTIITFFISVYTLAKMYVVHSTIDKATKDTLDSRQVAREQCSAEGNQVPKLAARAVEPLRTHGSLSSVCH